MKSNYTNYRRPAKRRVTGRFYVFLTVVFVLVVMLVVFFNIRSRDSQNPNTAPIVYDPNAANTVQTAPPVVTGPQPTSEIIPASQTGEEQTLSNMGDAQALGDALDGDMPTDADMDISDEVEEELVPLSDAEFQIINDVSARTDLDKSWRNIVLLGSDTRNMKNVEKSRCDTIMIASINEETGQIKLASLMRDMMIEIPGHGMQKITSATYYGGPELLMKVINEQLGMNITEYAIINFMGLANVIDKLEGIRVDITKQEMDQINETMGSVAKYTMDHDEYLAKKSEMMLKTYGQKQLLNGIQAVSYARIRKIDSDYKRTLRQRNVINAMMAGVKDASLPQVFSIATGVWGYVKTNVPMDAAVRCAWSVLNCKLDSSEKIKEWRLPGKETYATGNRKVNGTSVSALWDIDYPENAQRLHLFIYGSRFP